MVELFTTVIVTVCSAVLFGYWLRCAFVLLCGQYLPCPEEVPLNPTPPIPSNPRISWHPPPDRKS